jgi:SAM-dependent methyltransferase
MSDVHNIGPGRPDGFDGERYQERFDALEADGLAVHGEADFVMTFAPESVLDAGCGTGRVALELARRGVFVVGADRDASMLAVAIRRAAELAGEVPGVRLRFVGCPHRGHDHGTTIEVGVLAGNVPHFADPGTEQALVAGVARHVRVGGVLVAGFQLNRTYTLELFDLHCAASGLELAARHSSWDGAIFEPGRDYAVSVHRRP